MAKLSDEQINQLRDEWKEKTGYDQMSDEDKAKFDKAFDEVVDKYQKKAEGSDSTDGTEDDDDNKANQGNGKEREIVAGGRTDGKEVKKEENSDEDSVKKKEIEAANAEISENQRRMDAERQRKVDEAEKKDDREDVER